MLLTRDRAPVALGRRAALILSALLEARGAVVETDRLVEAGWADQVVEESNLSVQISRLRRTLGPRWIQTVERVGYQLIGASDLNDLPMRGPRLAVVPFQGDSEMAPAVTEALIEALTSLRSIVVATDMTVGAHRVDGSVRRIDGRLHVHTRLATDTGYIWSSSQAVGGDKIRGLARRVAAEVAWRVDEAELNDAPNRGQAIHDTRGLYLRARALSRTLNPAHNASAIALFDRALEREPENALILAGACEARHHRIAMGMPSLGPTDAEDCATLARRGLDQTDLDGGTMAIFGIALYRALDRDWGLAVTRRAATEHPDSFKAMLMAGNCAMHWGDVTQAQAFHRRALRLSAPTSERGFVLADLSRVAMMEGRYEDAIAWAERAFVCNPNHGGTHWTLVAANAQLGRRDRASRHLTRFRDLQPAASLPAIQAGQPTRDDRMNATLDGLALAGLT